MKKTKNSEAINNALAILVEVQEDVAFAIAALEPFAKMADGRDSWAPDAGCGTFPKVSDARRAREALRRLKAL